MSTFKVEIGTDAFDRGFKRLFGRTDDLSPLMQMIGETLSVSTKTRIRTGGPAPDGSAYAPKSPVTLEQFLRIGEGYDTRPLNHLGHLGNLGIHHSSGRDWAMVGASPEYAAVMQFGAKQGAFGRTKRGGPVPWGDIPARPFLGLSMDDERFLLEAVEEFLMGDFGE